MRKLHVKYTFLLLVLEIGTISLNSFTGKDYNWKISTKDKCEVMSKAHIVHLFSQKAQNHLNPNYIYINSHWIVPNQISVDVVDWKSIMVTTRKHHLHRKQKKNNASNVLC